MTAKEPDRDVGPVEEGVVRHLGNADVLESSRVPMACLHLAAKVDALSARVESLEGKT